MVALAVSGMAAAVMMVAGRTLLQRTSDEAVLARVFAVQEGTSLLGVALGAIVAPVLVDRLGPAEAFVPFGIAAALLTLACLPLLRRLDIRAVLRPHESALLRSIPFLDALPTYELEQLSRRAEWLDVPAGQVVVTQGDVGDRFYVIAEGQFGVSIDGVRRPGALGPGTGFGEIALLHAVPRTATVTADTDGPAAHGARRRLPGGCHGKPGRSRRGARGVACVPGSRPRLVSPRRTTAPSARARRASARWRRAGTGRRCRPATRGGSVRTTAAG